MTSPSIRAHKLHPELRYSSTHRMTKYLAINPSDDNTWCAIMSTPSSLLAFFHTGKLCLGSMVHLEFLLTTLHVLSIIRFSCQLIFNKLLYTESVERKPLPTLTKLLHGLNGLHGLHGLSFEKVTVVKWRTEKGKKVEEWTGSKLRSWSWSFVPAATCACLQPLTKHWSIYAKAATIVSPV